MKDDIDSQCKLRMQFGELLEHLLCLSCSHCQNNTDSTTITMPPFTLHRLLLKHNYFGRMISTYSVSCACNSVKSERLPYIFHVRHSWGTGGSNVFCSGGPSQTPKLYRHQVLRYKFTLSIHWLNIHLDTNYYHYNLGYTLTL